MSLEIDQIPLDLQRLLLDVELFHSAWGREFSVFDLLDSSVDEVIFTPFLEVEIPNERERRYPAFCIPTFPSDQGLRPGKKVIINNVLDPPEMLYSIWKLITDNPQPGRNLAIPLQPENIENRVDFFSKLVRMAAYRYIQKLYEDGALSDEGQVYLQPGQIDRMVRVFQRAGLINLTTYLRRMQAGQDPAFQEDFEQDPQLLTKLQWEIEHTVEPAIVGYNRQLAKSDDDYSLPPEIGTLVVHANGSSSPNTSPNSLTEDPGEFIRGLAEFIQADVVEQSAFLGIHLATPALAEWLRCPNTSLEKIARLVVEERLPPQDLQIRLRPEDKVTPDPDRTLRLAVFPCRGKPLTRSLFRIGLSLIGFGLTDRVLYVISPSDDPRYMWETTKGHILATSEKVFSRFRPLLDYCEIPNDREGRPLTQGEQVPFRIFELNPDQPLELAYVAGVEKFERWKRMKFRHRDEEVTHLLSRRHTRESPSYRNLVDAAGCDPQADTIQRLEDYLLEARREAKFPSKAHHQLRAIFVRQRGRRIDETEVARLNLSYSVSFAKEVGGATYDEISEALASGEDTQTLMSIPYIVFSDILSDPHYWDKIVNEKEYTDRERAEQRKPLVNELAASLSDLPPNLARQALLKISAYCPRWVGSVKPQEARLAPGQSLEVTGQVYIEKMQHAYLTQSENELLRRVLKVVILYREKGASQWEHTPMYYTGERCGFSAHNHQFRGTLNIPGDAAGKTYEFKVAAGIPLLGVRRQSTEQGEVGVSSPGETETSEEEPGTSSISVSSSAENTHNQGQQDHRGVVKALAFSPDSRHLVSLNEGRKDSVYTLWMLANSEFGDQMNLVPKKSEAFAPSTGNITLFSNAACAWRNDGGSFALATDLGVLEVLHPFSRWATQRIVYPRFESNSYPAALRYAENDFILVGMGSTHQGNSGMIKGISINRASMYEPMIGQVDFSVGGLPGEAIDAYALLVYEGKIVIFAVTQLASVHKLVFPFPSVTPERELTEVTLKSPSGFIRDASFYPAGSNVILGSPGLDSDTGDLGKVLIWDEVSKDIYRTLEPFDMQGQQHPPEVFRVAGSRKEETAAGYRNGKVLLWDIQGKPKKSFEVSDALILTLTFSPDGEYLAAGGFDGTVKAFRTSSPVFINGKERVSNVDQAVLD